jgi:hypothetical protein
MGFIAVACSAGTLVLASIVGTNTRGSVKITSDV